MESLVVVYPLEGIHDTETEPSQSTLDNPKTYDNLKFDAKIGW